MQKLKIRAKIRPIKTIKLKAAFNKIKPPIKLLLQKMLIKFRKGKQPLQALMRMEMLNKEIQKKRFQMTLIV